MSGPYFDTWKHQTLVRFAKDAYEKLQRQDEELQRLRLLTHDTQLMQQALEALIGARAFLESDAPVEIWGVNDKAIAALRARLAQPQRTHWEGCEEVHPECKEKNA